MQTSIDWNQLPEYSPWPARLLGNAHFAPRQRTRDEVLREYDREKWGAVLVALRADGSLTEEAILRLQGVIPDQMQPFMIDAEFFLATAQEIVDLYFDVIRETLSAQKTDILVELGCGLGDKLLKVAAHFKSKTVYGGEFTDAGAECGRILAAHRGLQATFGHFDYNDPSTMADVPEGAVVFTSHSIEQIPDLKQSFIKGLIARSPAQVTHFEPAYEDQNQNTLIGLLRQRYTEINDYNRNLVGLLHDCERQGLLRITDHRSNIFSDTPFNPTSVISWVPA